MTDDIKTETEVTSAADAPESSADAAETAAKETANADKEKAGSPKKQPRTPLRAAKPVSVLLAVILTFALFATALFGVIRATLSKEGIARIISGVDIGALLGGKASSPKEGAAVPGGYELADALSDGIDKIGEIDPNELPDLEAVASGDMSGLADYLYEVCGQETLEEANLTKDSLKTVLERSTVSEFISKKLADAADDFLKTGKATVINSDTIVELIRENEDLIEEITGSRLTEEHYSKISNSVASKAVNVEITAEDIKASTGVDVTVITGTVSKVTSPVGYIAAIAVCVMLAIAIFALHKFLIGRSLPYIAVPALICGILLFGIAAVIHFAGGAVMDGAVLGIAAAFNVPFVIRAAAFTAAGVVLLIAAIPLRRRGI